LWLVPVVVALLAHTAFVFESHRRLAFQFPLIDAASYHQQAEAAGAGGSFASGPFWQPPFYPFFLALVYRVGTQDYVVVRLLQAVVLALASLLTYIAARFVLSGRWSAVAGSLVGLYGPLLFFSSQLLPTGLATALNIAALAAGLRLLVRPHWIHGLLTGVLIGLGALTVPNILVVLPVVVWFSLEAHRRGGEDGAGLTTACVLLAVALVILPVSVRNWIVSGEWVPISTNGGINLYIGNNPHRSETIAIRPGIDWDRLASTPVREGFAGNASESGRYFAGETLRYVRDCPVSFLAGLAGKARQLLTGREIPRNLDLYTFREDSVLLRVLAWRIGPFGFPFGIIGPLAGVGLFMLLRRSLSGAFLATWLFLYLGSIVLFFPASRYFMPVIPCVLIAAVIGALGIWRGLSGSAQRDLKPAVFAVGLLILFSLPVDLPTDCIDFDAERRLYTGIALQTRGRQDEALAQYEAVLRASPTLSDAWFYRGTLMREMGRNEEAVASHREALRVRPDHYRAMNDLAVLLFKRGQIEEAVSLLRKSIELDPINRQTMRNLSVGLISLGCIEEANFWRERLGDPPIRGRTM